MSGGGFFGGVSSGIEGQQKNEREHREIDIREDALKNTKANQLTAEVDKAINGTMQIVAKTIEASRAAGASPDKVLLAVKPLLADIAGLAKNAGRDPGIYARQAEALLTIPVKPEKQDPKSPLGQLVNDRARLVAGGADPVLIRQFDQRIQREAEGAEKNAFANEHQLRGEHTVAVKPFREAEAAYSRMQAVTKAPSTAGDLAVIYNYVKLADPGNQVTESEFKKAENAKPLLAGLGINWDDVKAVWLDRKMPDPQREDFLNQGKALVEAAKKKRGEIDNRYREIASKHGIDPDSIAAPGRVPEGTPPVPGARQAPDGNWYIEKGGKFFRVEP